MKKFKVYLSFLVLVCSTILLSQNTEKKTVEYREMTLHDFMEDYAKMAAKMSQNGNDEPVKAILREIPNMSVDGQKEKWQKHTTDALASERFGDACKYCHKEFKKEYKATYQKRLIKVPVSFDKLLGYSN